LFIRELVEHITGAIGNELKVEVGFVRMDNRETENID
jgi:hypothetical protein